MSQNGTTPPSSPSEPPSSPNSQPPPPSTPTPAPSLTEPSATPPPQSSPPPVSLPGSSAPPPSSAPEPSSAPPQTSSPPDASSVVTAPSREPSTQIITSIVTPPATSPGESPTPIIVTITSLVGVTGSTKSNAPAATSTDANGLPVGPQDSKAEKSNGLSTGGKTAIAVVIPVVVVGLLVLAGIILWRKRKQRKNAEEDRRKEVEEYGYNPNNDPTLPAVGMASSMTEDQSGYRGWGNTTTSSNRKASTTLTSGMTYSDGGSNPGGYQSPNSPTHHSDGHSGDPLVNGRRETMDSEGISALGAAPNANQNQAGGVHRGPSNASSSYSAAARSDNSGDYPIPMNNPHDYYDNQGYYQNGPYGTDPYGGNQQPIIRDVSARRNTRIESPSVFPQQGNSGIAQNF